MKNEIHITAKTKRGVPCVRLPAPGSDKPPRVKGDTYDKNSVYAK